MVRHVVSWPLSSEHQNAARLAIAACRDRTGPESSRLMLSCKREGYDPWYIMRDVEVRQGSGPRIRILETWARP
jgi:hypothetical protein